MSISSRITLRDREKTRCEDISSNCTLFWLAEKCLIPERTFCFSYLQEVPLLQVPVHTDSGTINIKDVNLSGGQTYLDHFGSSGAAMDGRGTLTGQGMNMYNTYNYNYSTGQDQMDFMGGGTMAGQDMSFSKYRLTAFDGMALPDHYLGQYYSEVSFFTIFSVIYLAMVNQVYHVDSRQSYIAHLALLEINYSSR